MKLLGKYNNVDSAIPISFSQCVRDVRDGKMKDSSCGFSPDTWQIVWDYQGKGAFGQPLHLGEEIYRQIGNGDVVIMSRKQAIDLYNKANADKDFPDLENEDWVVEAIQNELADDW